MPTKTLRNFLLTISFALLLVFLATPTIWAVPQPKIVICHSDRFNGEYERLVVSPMAEGGHFDENGVPKPGGHEGDFILGLEGEVGDCPIGGTSEIPEPITMLLFGAGLATVGYVAKRRKQRAE